jgi:hypothetical protein
MKKIGYSLALVGVLCAAAFAFADRLSGGDGQLGAAQILGIEMGVVLFLIGMGLSRLDSSALRGATDSLRAFFANLPASSPTGWVIATFLAWYLPLFLSPLLFSNPTIHYFAKYIPDAWVTRVGFDAEQTVSHVQAWLTTGTSPYADGIVPYPPLALALFAPLVLLGYPAYFKFLSLLTVAAFTLAALLIPIWINRANRGGNSLILLFFLIGLFSYGFQFELERGQFNVIAFACALAAIYLFHYHKPFRVVAYLLFSLAVQLKLYPVIFFVMLIEDWRDWKSNLKRVAGLALFNFALLFVLGADLAGQFLTRIVSRQSGFVSSRVEDMSISGFVLQLATDGIVGSSGWLSVVLLGVFAACLLAILVHAYQTKQRGLNPYLLAICTLCALTIPAGSFDYKLPLLAAPLALALGRLPALPSLSKRLASLALTVLVSAAYWLTQYPFTVKAGLWAKNFPALFFILLGVTGLYFLTRGADDAGGPSEPPAF